MKGRKRTDWFLACAIARALDEQPVKAPLITSEPKPNGPALMRKTH
jgi:hypothetical protein